MWLITANLSVLEQGAIEQQRKEVILENIEYRRVHRMVENDFIVANRKYPFHLCFFFFFLIKKIPLATISCRVLAIVLHSQVKPKIFHY